MQYLIKFKQFKKIHHDQNISFFFFKRQDPKGPGLGWIKRVQILHIQGSPLTFIVEASVPLTLP